MRFRVLGPLEIETDDGPVVVSGRRPRAPLTALLLQPKTLVSTDRLVDALWAEDLPDSPANALYQVVTRLRARLGAGLTASALSRAATSSSRRRARSMPMSSS